MIEDDTVSDDEGTKTLKAMGKAANQFYDNLRDSGQQQTQVISDPAAMLQARINLAEKTAADLLVQALQNYSTVCLSVS